MFYPLPSTHTTHPHTHTYAHMYIHTHNTYIHMHTHNTYIHMHTHNTYIHMHTHTHTNTHTDTQTKYGNPRCACAPRVNKQVDAAITHNMHYKSAWNIIRFYTCLRMTGVHGVVRGN